MANPFDLEFEEMLPFFGVASGSKCTVFESSAPPPFPMLTPPPMSNIRVDQNWGVRFEWTTEGPMNYLMSGTWDLVVFLEKMGGEEFSLPLNTKTIPFVSSPNSYAVDFGFAPGVVPAGAYEIVTTVTAKGPGGFSGPIGAVGNGPVLQFYKVGP